jgi:hypothetical protein
MKKMRNAKDLNVCYTTTYQNVPDKRCLSHIAEGKKKKKEKRQAERLVLHAVLNIHSVTDSRFFAWRKKVTKENSAENVTLH